MQVAGGSGKRLGRRAGVPLVEGLMKMETKMRTMKGPVSETAVHRGGSTTNLDLVFSPADQSSDESVSSERRATGGEGALTTQAGGIHTKRTRTAATETAKTAVTTAKSEAHPESRMKVNCLF